MGDLLKKRRAPLPNVREVRGMGLLLGLYLDVPAKAVQSAMLECGVILGTSADPNILRPMPPMVVSDADFEHLISALSSVLAGISGV
jgi:acetylornithine aminotransferase